MTGGTVPDVTASTELDVGRLVHVRGQQWVVSQISQTPAEDPLAVSRLEGRALVTLTSVSEHDLGEELSVIWEVEPGRAVIPAGALPEVGEVDRWDKPQTLGTLAGRGPVGDGRLR